MQIVKSIKDILENTNTIDSYFTESYFTDSYFSDLKLDEFALGLIKRGTCFVAVQIDQKVRFYPSQFIGYKNNNYEKHTTLYIHGGETNKAIEDILGREAKADDNLEVEYVRFCEKLGFKANNKGNFGVERKYWKISIVVD